MTSDETAFDIAARTGNGAAAAALLAAGADAGRADPSGQAAPELLKNIFAASAETGQNSVALKETISVSKPLRFKTQAG
jgi:hypothetical protein